MRFAQWLHLCLYKKHKITKKKNRKKERKKKRFPFIFKFKDGLLAIQQNHIHVQQIKTKTF